MLPWRLGKSDKAESIMDISRVLSGHTHPEKVTSNSLDAKTNVPSTTAF